MKIQVTCPHCARAMEASPPDVAYELKCPGCGSWFMPLEDTGVPCPRCGEIMLAAPVLDPNEKFTCIQCGFVFTSRWRQIRWAVLAGLATLFLLVVAL